MKKHSLLLALSITTILYSHNVISQTRERETIDEKYTWNLADVYPNQEAWESEKDQIINKIPELSKYKGKLEESPETLINFLDLYFDMLKNMIKIYSFAGMQSNQDTRDAGNQAMVQEMAHLYSQFLSEASFFEPEILQMDQDQLDKLIKQNERLKIYEFYLRDIMRREKHTLSMGEEKIIAESLIMAGNSSSVYEIFTNAEFPYPEITILDGSRIELTKSNYSLYRASTVREDRINVFIAFFGALEKYKGTFGTQLYGEVKKNIFYKNVRNFNSCLESSLNSNNIPTEVYYSLIENVNKNLGTFHRYLKLREKILGVDQLHYFDLYPPLLGDVDLNFTIEESIENITEAMKPLGKEYGEGLDKAFTERWIDVYPTPGKLSGAYSNGSVYEVHPYILMNYNGKYDDQSTLAHELGHTMHSYFSNKYQPWPLADYSIFVAEVASTFNEALLSDYMLSKTNDDKIQLSILGSWLEGIKGTLFRQTQFAEFELKIHELAEKGEALTGEKLGEIYLDITKKYYGHEKGICVVDDYIKSEWSFIPHFYYNFYMYQYATSYTASQALSEQMLNGDKEATDKYLKFLSSGGSVYPIELLKEAGVDMTTSLPFDLTINKMNRVMDQIEEIYKRLKP